MSTQRTHRKFSPSQSERFTLCRGSVNLLQRTPPRPTSKWAEEGTQAHNVLEYALRNSIERAADVLTLADFAYITFENDDKRKEFCASVDDALDYVFALLQEIDLLHGDAVLFVESEVHPPVSSAPGEASGFCDIAIYSASARRLWVMDYKHGAGIAKAVIGNSQVKQYACGFLFQDNSSVDPANVDTVTLVIIQPRAFHPDGDIRAYDTTPAALFDYLMELDAIIEDCQRPDAPLTPGEDQCRFCDARTTCPAAEAAALRSISTTFAAVRDVAEPRLPDPKQLDVQRLAYIKQSRSLIVGWLDAVDKHIDELMRSGQEVPGFKMVQTRAEREWYGDDKEVISKLAGLIGCTDYELYRVKMPTITDAERMVVEAFKARVPRGRRKQAAEDAKQAMAFLTLKQSSGNVTVVPAEDPRPAVNKAQQTFGEIKGLQPPTPTEG